MMFRRTIDDDTELRLLDGRCVQELWELTDQNRDHLRPWLPWVDSTTSPLDTIDFVRGALRQYADDNGFQAGIWYQGRLAGAIGYHYWNWHTRSTEIGYWLGAAYTGRGLMTAACRAMINYAFDDLRLNRVEIRCAVGNQPSRAIPERLGFKLDGVLRQLERLPGGLQDQLVWSMLRSEWTVAGNQHVTMNANQA
jgi:ribosomal-protein-serine acetyltransferase